MDAKNLVSLEDLRRKDIWELIEYSRELKRKLRDGTPTPVLKGKTLAMIFLKPSLRTRTSFEVGMTQLGGHAIYLGPDDIKLGQRETTEDIALVLSRYVDGIMARVFGHEVIEELGRFARVPVINGLSDLLHPCQALGDLLSIYEYKRRLTDLRLAFVGDGNNVAHSLIHASGLMGIDFALGCPEGFEPGERIVRRATDWGGRINIYHDPQQAVSGADVVYTDVWASMGEEEIAGEKKSDFEGYTVDGDLLQLAEEDAIVMHCLPAHYGEEITKEVAHGPQSIIFDQAENRLHAQKALMGLLL